jgi:hypothetical protein
MKNHLEIPKIRFELDIAGAGIFLQICHIASHPCNMQASSYLFGICGAGFKNSRTI